MTEKNRYIIIGSGIAGMAAAEGIRAEDPEGIIRMISEEKELCFNRPMLICEFAPDGSGSGLFEKQQDWPKQLQVEVLLGTAVKSIDRKGRRILLADGTEESYDKLIYALGAKATIPPIPGADRPNVHVIRTREDMRRIREDMWMAESAAVIGGGMLGLEDAWALAEQKVKTSIVERQQRVAFGQIDQSAGNLMKKRIERMGVPVYVNAEVEEICDGYINFCLPSSDGKKKEKAMIPADLVILSAGVTPNSALGAEAGLDTRGSESDPASRWIAVDRFCRTSDPDIYAAGDAAATERGSDAIWEEARQMGRVAGINAAAALIRARGEKPQPAGRDESDPPAEYVPVIPEHVFNGFDTELFTMADSSGAGTDGVYIRHADVEIFDYQRERYIRVSLQDGIIAGILLINAPELAPELMDAYHRRAGEEEAREIVLRWKEDHEVDFRPAR